MLEQFTLKLLKKMFGYEFQAWAKCAKARYALLKPITLLHIPSHYLFHRYLNALHGDQFLYFFCYLFTVFSGRTFSKNYTGNFLVRWGASYFHKGLICQNGEIELYMSN